LQKPAATGRLAFVSSGTFATSAGLHAADSLCAAEARAAGLSGSFKALLAVDGASAASRFDLRGSPWVRLDGVAIADDASAFANGKLNAPIDVTAFGAYAVNAGWAWTGAYTPQQVSATTCSSWTSASADIWGIVAMVRDLSSGGMDAGTLPCNFGPYPVFCLQE
jgi:hypothetical protein